MGDERRTHLTPRSGPVAGLPIDSLLQRAEEIARRWAISLVVSRPLSGLGEVPLEELAREAPALCAQALRALESDEELDRLTGSRSAGRQDSAPARRLGAISGADDDAAATVEAAEALRGALWEALLEELRWPSFEQLPPRRVADISDRLAFVCASALAAALAAGAPASEDAAGDSGAAGADSEAEDVRVQREPSAARRAVIVDERAEASGAPRHRPAQIEIRDERGDVGPAAWIGSIGRQLERFKRDGRPFAVLLVELRDSDRMRSDSRLEEVSRLADQLEHALASELRRSAARAGADGLDPRAEPASGSLTRERPGRYWLLSPDTDRIGARVLAERLADALRRLAGDRGASLEVAVGTAACPEDGREAAALAAHADVELYAARSAAGTPAGRPPASVD